MEQIEACGMTFRVVRSGRTTVCIRISKDGVPEVLAPRNADSKTLCSMILPYCARLQKQLDEKQKQLEARRSFSVTYGDRVRYLGGHIAVLAGREGEVRVDDDAFRIPPSLEGESFKYALSEAYKLAAKNYLTRRVGMIAPMLGQTVTAVKVNSAASHWASASVRQTLNFSLFCIMAKPEAVDYIIIHELCHFTEFNHSKRFWALVERYCPDYKAHKAYLKELWREMEAEDLI